MSHKKDAIKKKIFFFFFSEILYWWSQLAGGRTLHPFLRHPPLYPTCSFFKIFVSHAFFHPTPFKDILYSFPHPNPLSVNPTISSTHQPPLNHYIEDIYFQQPTTINSNETNQILIHLLFFILLCHRTDYWLSLLEMTFPYWIVEELK